MDPYVAAALISGLALVIATLIGKLWWDGRKSSGDVGQRVIVEQGKIAGPVTVTQGGTRASTGVADSPNLKPGTSGDILLVLRSELTRLSDEVAGLRELLREKDSALERVSDKRATDGQRMVAEMVRQLERIAASVDSLSARIDQLRGVK